LAEQMTEQQQEYELQMSNLLDQVFTEMWQHVAETGMEPPFMLRSETAKGQRVCEFTLMFDLEGETRIRSDMESECKKVYLDDFPLTVVVSTISGNKMRKATLTIGRPERRERSDDERPN